jgi:hypothetical protein
MWMFLHGVTTSAFGVCKTRKCRRTSQECHQGEDRPRARRPLECFHLRDLNVVTVQAWCERRESVSEREGPPRDHTRD